MATNMDTLTLLNLPLELRNIIYSELLSSRRFGHLELYDDSNRHHTSYNLYPSILRTNKQIYAEAIPYLYKANIFRLRLEIDHSHFKRPILPLFRCDDTLQLGLLVVGKYYARPRTPDTYRVQHTKIYEYFPPLPGPKSIYPHILRRLAHIELITGASSICGTSEDGKFLTPIGKVVLDVLRLLAEEEIEEGLVNKKTLRIRIRPKWTPENLFLGDKGPSLSREEGPALKAEMLALLKEIKKRRIVEVKEPILYEVPGRLVTKVVDIDTGEAFQE